MSKVLSELETVQSRLESIQKLALCGECNRVYTHQSPAAKVGEILLPLPSTYMRM